MRYLYSICLVFITAFSSTSVAQNWEDRRVFGAPNSGQTLRVISSTDTAFFAPIIEQFVEQNLNVSVEYWVTSTAELNQFVQQTPDKFDVVISSAMDLQLKLVNDGYALKINGVQHPEWAQWRQSLFGFSAEPAVIVINRAAFKGRRKPQTRQDLIIALRARPDVFRNKVGTYDVRASGLGYLFATQDARVSETYWRLMEVMGGLNAKLYCCSGDMLDDVADGTLAIAYNVLGSYAAARQDALDNIEIIRPADFPTTMMRTAFVSKGTPHRSAAINFLVHLVTRTESAGGSEVFHMPSVSTEPGAFGQSMITLEPALLTYLDVLKRNKFVEAWENAVIQSK